MSAGSQDYTVGAGNKSDHAYNLRNNGSYHEFCEAADYLDQLEVRLAEAERELAEVREIQQRTEGNATLLHMAMYEWVRDRPTGSAGEMLMVERLGWDKYDGMNAAPDGEFVTFNDYDVLAARLAAMEDRHMAQQSRADVAEVRLAEAKALLDEAYGHLRYSTADLEARIYKLLAGNSPNE